ncbi:MAG: hypothetical protein RLZ98_1384 [Pseudomonadota bacterium]|jgi:predicted metal-dependent enzyme (double-stranded beta helix superfamily)
MSYTLEQFCKDAHDALKTGKPLEQSLVTVAEDLKKLLNNKAFVNETFNEDTPFGKRVLYHDPELDFYVLAHVQHGGKKGSPHSHGSSWAIYGNARESTRMREWSRVNPEAEEKAVLRLAEDYLIGPGQARPYPPGKIHSTEQTSKAWVIRVTGTDLDHVPRYRFKKDRDEILETA